LSLERYSDIAVGLHFLGGFSKSLSTTILDLSDSSCVKARRCGEDGHNQQRWRNKIPFG
jgi:hypothetical protein